MAKEPNLALRTTLLKRKESSLQPAKKRIAIGLMPTKESNLKKQEMNRPWIAVLLAMDGETYLRAAGRTLGQHPLQIFRGAAMHRRRRLQYIYIFFCFFEK